MLKESNTDDFAHTTRYFGSDEIFYEKGIYPYDYVSSPLRLDKTAFWPKVDFYNSLTDEYIDDKQYAMRALAKCGSVY